MLSVKYAVFGTLLSISAITGPSAALDIAAPSGEYRLDPAHASLIWKVNHFGLSNYTSRFRKFDVELTLDVENVEKSKLSVSIDPLSVKTDFSGEVDFDAEIASGTQFLNSGSYPSIKFVSKYIESTGDVTALIHGDMTMLGVTKSITLNAKLNGTMAEHPYAKAPAVGFHAEGSIKRSDFGFDYLIPYIGDDVSFVVEAEFIQAK